MIYKGILAKFQRSHVTVLNYIVNILQHELDANLYNSNKQLARRNVQLDLAMSCIMFAPVNT